MADSKAMLMTKDQVKSAAMQLDPLDREALAEELLLSIDHQQSAEIDAAWLAEAKRRDAEFIAGANRLLSKSSR